MDFAAFEARAREIFSQIPATFRHGISVLSIHENKKSHPLIDDYVTLGECTTDPVASAFADSASESRSQIHLYFGSFADLATRERDFPWEEELRETIYHEVQHDLEFRAGVDHLGDQDEVEEQNERRRQGLPFDVYFYRGGESPQPGEYWVGLEVFLELESSRRSLENKRKKSEGVLSLHWGEQKISLTIPKKLEAVNFLPIEGGWEDESGESGDLFVVLLCRRGIFA